MNEGNKNHKKGLFKIAEYREIKRRILEILAENGREKFNEYSKREQKLIDTINILTTNRRMLLDGLNFVDGLLWFADEYGISVDWLLGRSDKYWL